ncbi:LysR substrate-binding domain-containing protein [Blastococcus brunescens]|uniref:LysR substrate-binding domain-containing protein n=1 Tax=Blastococcus brunescens TaxID=1564165 RepID=A0ABZ1AY79_9ACTN|nr:LysR substrate-binding domain-containing protein [Blastococcus sp. BMG 8361]WRL62378.1 LysR substrate-binding domain-containing protein [Blastococcus sp. BMG 8361]
MSQASSTGQLRVLATAACAEHAAGAAVAAFTRRVNRTAVDLTVGTSDCAGTALDDDLADIVLGVRPGPAAGPVPDSVPFLRYERIVVAAPAHPLAARTCLRVTDLAGCSWHTGPGGIEAGSEEERWADRVDLLPDVEQHGSEAVALTAVRAGAGVQLALGHAVAGDLRRGSLVRLPVEGTPVSGLWWATIPGDGRATSAARALQRFLTTPDATSALLSRPARQDRARPTVRVELWS